MTIPIWYLLIIYGLFLIITGLFFTFNFFHIAKFGLQGTKTALLLIAYVILTTAVVLFNVRLLSSFDWTQTISLETSADTIFEI